MKRAIFTVILMAGLPCNESNSYLLEGDGQTMVVSNLKLLKIYSQTF
jgi:hypothetical protein